MYYFGSEEFFETNVSSHYCHALVPVTEQFLKHELDFSCMKLKEKMLSSSVANALQPQTGLDWTRAALGKNAKQNPVRSTVWILGSQTLSLYKSARTDPHK